MSALLNFFTGANDAPGTDDAVPHPGILANAVGDIEAVVRAGSAMSPADLPAYIDAIKNLNGVGINDRLFLLEKLLTFMSRLPPDSSISQKMQSFFIDTLYKDLPHPPASFLSPVSGVLPTDVPKPPKRNYNYRSSDGSKYNPQFPTLGQAGTPYARSVPSANLLPPSALPDPGLLFDLLLKRSPSTPTNPFQPHPGGLSAMFFAVANLVIHSIFDTSRADWNVNDTSSYIDLSPLYGNPVSGMKRRTEEMRVGDGTGRVWEDCFADARLLFMPPATAVVLVLLSRNHNYIADKILNINERGTFSNPPPTDDAKRKAQDDEIFERARLVNCGVFARIVLYDYVGGILGMTRDGSSFRLNLTEAIRQGDHEFAPTGQGNQISAEFNLLYRWHASTSAGDEQWIDGVFKEILQGKPYNQVTVDDFTSAAGKFMRPPANIREWTFGGLKRDANGRFRDADLANIIVNATEAPAHAFGARRTPEALRIVEVMTIMQGRAWGVCTLNEFRTFFGLRPYSSFAEWNPDPEISNAAQALYRHIDNLELHVGLQAEETKPAMSGAGLCPSYTMSRAILADAVVLCRSDPYLTTEFTPYNCTAWGYQDCIVNPNDGSYGGMLTKMLFRHLPGHFAPGSAYAHFPLLVPKTMRSNMIARKDPAVNKYSWERPKEIVPIVSMAATNGLVRQDGMASSYDARVAAIVKGVKLNRTLIENALVGQMAKHPPGNELAQLTSQLIREKSILRPGFGAKQLDIVQDVLNLVPVYFLANSILGLSLKTKSNPRGKYTPQKMYELFANVGSYVLFQQGSAEEWSMKERAESCATTVISQVRSELDRLSSSVFSLNGLLNALSSTLSIGTGSSDQFLSSLLEVGKQKNVTHDQLAASLFAELVPTAAQYSSALAHMVDFYLDEHQAQARASLVSLASSSDGVAGGQLLEMAKNALQSEPPPSNALQAARTDVVVGDMQAVAGQRVEAAVGTDGKGLMDTAFFDKTAPSVLRAIFGLKNVRKAPGTSGQLPKFTEEQQGTRRTLYVSNESAASPWPTGLIIEYDV